MAIPAEDGKRPAEGEAVSPDPTSRAMELKSLGDALIHPPSMDTLSTWVAAGTDRISFLTNTIWGNVRWPKAIGRSLGPTLASGFTVEHWYNKIDAVVIAPGVIEDRSKWIRVDPPSVWDVPQDGDEYRVSFMCYASALPNAIRVQFAEHQAWDSPLQVRLRAIDRQIVSTQHPFVLGDAKYIVLEDCTLVEVPIRHF